MPINRLAQLVLNNGGKTLDEAVATARAKIDEIKHIAFEGIETAIAALEKLLIEAGENDLTELQMQDVLSYTDRLLTLSDAFEFRPLRSVARSLADLALGLKTTNVRSAEPIAVHVRAARLLAPSSPPVPEEEVRRLLDQLRRLVVRLLPAGLLPADEEQRQAVLERLNVLDIVPEEQFDRLTRLTAKHFNVPIALISLIDNDRHWFLSKCGLDVNEMPRDALFCPHVLDDAVLVVLDAANDQRFANSPLVVSDPKARFYVGAPLISAEGVKLGALCIIDSAPRGEFGEADQATLQDLAKRVVDMIYARAFHWLSDQGPEAAAQSMQHRSGAAPQLAESLADNSK